MTNNEELEVNQTTGLNPFPSSAVARLSPISTELLTIKTDAVKKSLSYLESYLARSGGTGSKNTEDGNVIAIVGEYGTGKTHITLELLERIRRSDTPSLYSFYLDAPADTFLALYKERFIPKLSRSQVRERVEEYFSDIVAKELEKSQLTRETAKHLRARRLLPLEVIRNLGLTESELMQRLHEELLNITENKYFGTALSLFLRPEFEDAVWEWLRGSPPDSALTDRGIERTLDSDPLVLEAIGVFAFLFGRQQHRFVLVIDEMEKVLSHSTPRKLDGATLLALKKLMEVMGKTHALLVLSGLPDFLEVLPEDAQQRISCIIRPTALTAEDTIQYIREAQKRATSRERLKPFTSDTAAYMAEIAGGNARKVVRLCYHVFQSASEAGTDVTRAMIREVAREQFELNTKEDVLNEIARTIDQNGWLFEQQKVLVNKKQEEHIDFWLPVGGGNSGCVILVSKSILHEQEAQEIASQVQRLRSAFKELDQRNKKTEVLGLLVVNGYLAENLAPILHKTFDRIILHNLRNFTQDIDAALKGLVRRIEESFREDSIAIIRERVERISRQSSSTREVIEEISTTIPNAYLMQRVFEQSIRSIFGQIGGQFSKDSDSRFPQVTATFDRRDKIISEFQVSLDNSISSIFDFSIRQSRFKSSWHANEENISLLEDEQFRASLILVLILEKSISSFRKSIFNILSFVETDGSKRSITRIRDAQNLCMEFENLIHPIIQRNHYRNTSFNDISRRGIRQLSDEELIIFLRLPNDVRDSVEHDWDYLNS